MKSFKLGILSVIVAMGLVIGIKGESLADPINNNFQLFLSNNLGTNITVIDNGPGDEDPGTGVIDYSPGTGHSGFSNWVVVASLGQTYPVLGSPSEPSIDLSQVNSSSTRAGTFTVELSAAGFTAANPSSGWNFSVGGTVENGGTVNFSGFEDNTNTIFGTQNSLFSTANMPGPGAFSFTTSGSVPTVNPYSMTIVANITHTRAGTTTWDGGLTTGKVPEPISLILYGLGFAGAGLYRRLRKK